MIDLQDYDVECVEQEIIWQYHKPWMGEPDSDSPITIQNFTPCKVKNDKDFGAQSVTAIGTLLQTFP